MHTKETVSEIAKSFNTRAAFKNGHPGAYAAALRNKWIDDVCSHMEPLRTAHTVESITESAKIFSSRSEFKQKNPKAYDAACRLKCLEIACAHMKPILIHLTESEILSRALAFSSRTEFSKCDPSAYCAAQRRGILEKACAHMKAKVNRKLTKQEIIDRAKPFKTRAEFQKCDGSAYNVGLKNNWLDDACAHMEKANSRGGFDLDKPAFLYQIKFTLPNGALKWKIGITNASARKRIYGMRVFRNVTWEITHEIPFKIGRDARLEEIRLHGLGKSKGASYSGPAFLKNGVTEIFNSPIL